MGEIDASFTQPNPVAEDKEVCQITLQDMWGRRRSVIWLSLFCCAMSAGCGTRLFQPRYEYEEELYLDLDGSATLNLNTSVAALVALRGADLPTDPRAWLDRRKVRALFQGAGSPIALNLSRRRGRRYVHVSVRVDDVRQLAAMRPFSWSTYRFDRTAERIDFHQVVGPPARRAAADVQWTGDEVVAFRIHLPSEIQFENSERDVQRGNIVEWRQSMSSRLRAEPVDVRVQIAPESILYTTLVLFGSTVVAAAAAFAAVIWWLRRRGAPGAVAPHP